MSLTSLRTRTTVPRVLRARLWDVKAVCAAFAAALLTLSACKQSKTGEFEADGYRHPRYPYAVFYEDQKGQALMAPDWQLDNLYWSGPYLKTKTGPEYEVDLYLDLDGDGVHEKTAKVPTYDLRFEHRRNDGVIWLRTIPIGHDLQDKELRVLAERLVENIAGGGYDVIQLEGRLELSNKERRFATKIVDARHGRLAGQEAYVVMVDVANIDQRELAPDSIQGRLLLVLAHTNFTYEPFHARQPFPVLMLAGYANTPRDFEASIADFNGLLSRISIDRNAGFTTEKTAPDARAEPAAQAPSKIEPTDGGTPQTVLVDAGRASTDGG